MSHSPPQVPGGGLVAHEQAAGTHRLLTVEYTASYTVGISLSLNANSALPVNRVIVVLKKQPNLSLGYYILTAYIKP